jgi:hypothetical protein
VVCERLKDVWKKFQGFEWETEDSLKKNLWGGMWVCDILFSEWLGIEGNSNNLLRAQSPSISIFSVGVSMKHGRIFARKIKF